MIISSWNINSVRIRTENIEKYINKINPDILMFQEIKCEDDKFPYEFFENKNIIAMSLVKNHIMELQLYQKKNLKRLTKVSKIQINNQDFYQLI